MSENTRAPWWRWYGSPPWWRHQLSRLAWKLGGRRRYERHYGLDHIPAAWRNAPGWEGAVGPFRADYGKPHVYARDIHSGAGNCVCGLWLGAKRHIQAAPGIPIPERLR